MGLILDRLITSILGLMIFPGFYEVIHGQSKYKFEMLTTYGYRATYLNVYGLKLFEFVYFIYNGLINNLLAINETIHFNLQIS